MKLSSRKLTRRSAEAPAKREIRRVVFRAGTPARGPGARGRTGGRNPVDFRG